MLNLADVDHIDSMGLGALVSAFASVRKQGGELKLLNLTDKAADLMQVTKLYTVFDIVNDEAGSVKSFGQSSSENVSGAVGARGRLMLSSRITM